MKRIKHIFAMTVLVLACAALFSGCPSLGFDEDTSGYAIAIRFDGNPGSGGDGGFSAHFVWRW